MSLRDIIQSQCRSVITDQLGSAWEYRLRTSADDAQTPTYGAWTAITAHLARTSEGEAYDGERDLRRTTRDIEIRTSDAVTLDVGDQFTEDSGTTIYVITQLQSTGLGTRFYRAVLTTSLVADDGRGGGL